MDLLLINANQYRSPPIPPLGLEYLGQIGFRPAPDTGYLGAVLGLHADDIDSRIWQGSPYTAFDDIGQFKADVIVMYNLSSGMTEKQKQNFLKLLEQGVGLVVWHHALANCQDWPEFEKIAGAKFWLQPGERNGYVLLSGRPQQTG